VVDRFSTGATNSFVHWRFLAGPALTCGSEIATHWVLFGPVRWAIRDARLHVM